MCSVGVAALNTASRCGQIFFGHLVNLSSPLNPLWCSIVTISIWLRRQQTAFTNQTLRKRKHILVQEVQPRSDQIYGTASRPPQGDNVKLAWEEITNIVNLSSPGTPRTAAQCSMMWEEGPKTTSAHTRDRLWQCSFFVRHYAGQLPFDWHQMQWTRIEIICIHTYIYTNTHIYIYTHSIYMPFLRLKMINDDD